MQNRSHAVMAQRVEGKGSPDDFPTPPWATRALLEHVIPNRGLASKTCMEPSGASQKQNFQPKTYPRTGSPGFFGVPCYSTTFAIWPVMGITRLKTKH